MFRKTFICGIERIGLEHHGNAPCRGRKVVDPAAADFDVSAVCLLEAGEEAQKGGLAAARRPDDDGKLAIGDAERHRFQDLFGSEGLAHVMEAYIRHEGAPLLDRAGGQAAHKLARQYEIEDEYRHDCKGECGQNRVPVGDILADELPARRG